MPILCILTIKNIYLGSAVLNVGARGTHSISKNMAQAGMQIKILTALSDNYMYLVRILNDGYDSINACHFMVVTY